MTRPHFSYGSLVTTSLRFAWLMKSLWILGVLVGSAGGYGGKFTENFEDTDLGDWTPFVVLAAISVGLILLIVGIALRTIAEGGLIHAGAKAAGGVAASLGESWGEGLARFFNVLFVYLASVAVVMAAAVIAFVFPVGIGIAAHPVLGVIVGLFTVPVFLGAFLFWVPLSSYALRLTTLERLSFADSWSRAFTYIRRAPGRAIGLSLTRLAFLFLVFAVELALTVAIIGPIAILWALWEPLAIGVGILIGLPILLVLAGYLGSAGSYFWTLGFLWTRETIFGGSDDSDETPPEVIDTPA